MWGSHKRFSYRDENYLYDTTKAFLELFSKIMNLPSIIMMILGGRGSGKTAHVFKLVELFRYYLTDSVCFVFWNAPKSFIGKLQRYAPKELTDHLYSIDKLRKLTELRQRYEYMVLIYDEAQRDLNAKQALDVQNRKLGKMIAITRQQNIFMIYGSQNVNVLKDLRTMTDFRFYKGIGSLFIRDSKDIFLKAHARYIKNLYAPKNKSKCAFEACYSGFFKPNGKELITEGFIDIELFDVVPYWNEEISRAYEDVDLDSDFEEFVKLLPEIENATKKFLEAFPRVKKGDIQAREIRGFLQKVHPAIYFDLKEDIKLLLDNIYWELFVKENAKKDKEEEKEQDQIEMEMKLREIYAKGMDFSKYVREYYTRIGDETKAQIGYELIQGLSQNGVAGNLGIAVGKVNEMFSEMREKKIGYLFEDWCGEAFELIIFGSNKSIIDGITKDGRIFTIKWRYRKAIKQLNYQKSGKDFRPSNILADYYKSPYGLIHIFPPWKLENQLKILKLDPFPSLGSDNFMVSKDRPSLSIEDIPPVKELGEIYEKYGKDGLRQHIVNLMTKIKNLEVST